MIKNYDRAYAQTSMLFSADNNYFNFLTVLEHYTDVVSPFKRTFI